MLDKLRAKAFSVLTSATGDVLPPVRLGKKAALLINDLAGRPLADPAELERRAQFERDRAARHGQATNPVAATTTDVPIVIFHRGEQREVAAIEELLRERRLRFDLRDLEDDEASMEAVRRDSGGRPLPCVFIAGTAIGGEGALRRMIDNGQLDKLLATFAWVASPGVGRGAALGDPALPAQVYGTETCPWTGRARALLERENVAYTFIDLASPEGAAFADRLTPETSHNTQPWIFLRGQFIGGFNALDEIARLGQLEDRTRASAEPRTGRINIVVAERDNTDETALGEILDRQS